MPTKKIFLVVLILFVAAGASLAVYNLFLKNGDGPADRNGTKPPPDGQPELKISLVSEQKAFALALSPDKQKARYYSKNNGHVFEASFDGSRNDEITTNDLAGLVDILWSPDGKKVIGIFKNQGVTKKYFYDHETKKGALLDGSIGSIAWSPSSQKIAYHFKTPDGQTNNISVADPDGSNWREVFQTRLENLEVQWPSPNKIYILSKPGGKSPGVAFAISLNGEAFEKSFDNVYGLDAKWSPDGQRAIYQATDEKGKNLKLYVASWDGSGQKQLPLSTLVKKCVWSDDSQNLFCAVPQKISQNAVWPDDYLAGRTSTEDDFYVVDTLALKETKIIESGDDQKIDVDQILLSPKEDYLLFTNRFDDLAYSLELKIK